MLDKNFIDITPQNQQEEILKRVIEICAEVGNSESAFLTPSPDFMVSVTSLFEQLEEEFKIPKNKVAGWFNTRMDKRELEEKGA